MVSSSLVLSDIAGYSRYSNNEEGRGSRRAVDPGNSEEEAEEDGGAKLGILRRGRGAVDMEQDAQHLCGLWVWD